jgi:hypothetical protein
MDDSPHSDRYLEIAGKIVKRQVGRSVFQQLYDAVVEPLVPDRAQPFLSLAKLRERRNPGLAGPEKDQADFAEALRQAADVDLLVEFFACNAEQLFSDVDRQATISLQSIANLDDVFHQALQMTMGRMDALRRACRITCAQDHDAPVMGSGFLIGPHLVLTNFHVVKSLVEIDKGKAIAKEGSHLQITIEFDALLRADGGSEARKPFRAPNAWLVDYGMVHPEESTGGGRGPNAPWPDEPMTLAQRLDFAIIELDGAPGYERGWYDLEASRWPQPKTRFDLFQFPRGQLMAVMGGEFEKPAVFDDNNRPPRILHNANTLGGSSGGLCLDHESHAVALHQAGYEFTPGFDRSGDKAQRAVKNMAIPLPCIANAAGKKIKDKIANAPRIVSATSVGEPVLGRTRLQSLVDEMIRGAFRILIVQSGADPAVVRGKLGKTFSKAIIRALLPPGPHVVFEVAAARLTSDAVAAAAALVAVVGAEAPAIAAPPRQFSAKDADELAQSAISKLTKAAGNSIPWLIIDDLDHFPIQAETTTATFLDAFYRRAIAETNLRIVLVGPLAAPASLASLSAKTDVIRDHITDGDVETWIARQFRDRGALAPEHVRILVNVIRSMGAAEANDQSIGRTKATAENLFNHWVPSLRTQA